MIRNNAPHRRFARIQIHAVLLGCALALGVLPQALTHAANVTNHVFVDFDGQISSTQYVMASNEYDSTNTFRVSGSPTLSSGVATIPGDTDIRSGFYFNANSLGSLPNVNWFAEVLYKAQVGATSQPGTFNHLIDVEGDLFLRYNSNNSSSKLFEYGYYDGTDRQQTITEPSTTTFEHWALAWNASTNSLTAYQNGSALGTTSGGDFETPSANVGFGFFARTGFFNRAVDGMLDAVAFSTYTGTFDPSADLQLLDRVSTTAALELTIDSSTGSVLLQNTSNEVVSLNGYEITSDSGSLVPERWKSLDSQSTQVAGATVLGWQAGGSTSETILIEAVLDSSTPLLPGDSLWLGYAYDTSGSADIALRYRLAGQSGLQLGSVTYDSNTVAVAGDYNADGLVDQADYVVWRNHLGAAYALQNDTTPATVSHDDYLVWKQNFGTSSAPLTSTLQSVPEPRGLQLWLCSLCLLGVVLPIGRRKPLCLLLFAAAMSMATAGSAQTPPAPYGVVPTERQLAWHQQEYYAFLHFGPNTFTDEEWGWSQSTPDIFNPTSLDTDQWARSLKEAGMTGMILTAKHHDGMALWDTATTEYRIGNSTWATSRTSSGLDTDVVRMAAESAKAYGLNFGVYLSPWDMHRDPTVSKAGLAGTKYDEPQIFGDANGTDYNDFYAAQLTELVTMELSDGSQIELTEVWLDGASGSSTVQTFDWARYRDIIRQHQPNAVMWGHQGVDARWVGNEDGYAPTTNWHTIDRTQDDARYSSAQLETGVRHGAYWTPAESDARLRDGWFYHEDESPKSTSQLLDMYLNTVGRSVNLLLDVPPNADGQLATSDVNRLLEFNTVREQLLDRNLASTSTTTASAVRANDSAAFGSQNIVDGDFDTYWTMDDASTTGYVDIDLGGPRLINGFIAQEYIALGQRIGGYAIEAQINGTYQTLVTGTSLGYQRIHVLDQAVETSRVRLRITQADATPLISEFEILGDVLIGFTGDVNYDGVLNYQDWMIYIQWAGADLTGLSASEAFARGDFNGDYRNDLADFDLFVSAYDQWNGEGAYSAMLTTAVPELPSLYPLTAGVLVWMAVRPSFRCGGETHDQS